MKTNSLFISLFLTTVLITSCMLPANESAKSNSLGTILPLISIILVIVILVIAFKNKINKKISFSILGAILGIPLSYYFQSEMVKSKVGGIGGYLQNFGDIVDNSDLLGNVIISIIVFALVGGVIGYFIDENEAKKTK